MKKILATIFCIFIVTTILGGCGKKQKPMDLYDVIQQRGKVVIGIKPDVRPFCYFDENQNYTGYEIDLAKAIAKTLLNDETLIEFVPLETSDKIMTLNSGQADMIIGLMTITPQRAAIIDFSNTYYVAGQTVMTLKNSPIDSLSDLQNKRVGVIFGTTAEKEIVKLNPSIVISGFKTYTSAVEALKAKEIDAIALDDTILTSYSIDNTDLKVLKQRYTKEPYGIAFRKGIESERVLDMVNALIERMNADGSFNKLKKQYKI